MRRDWIEIDLFKLEQTAPRLAVMAAHGFVDAARKWGRVEQIRQDGMADVVRVLFPPNSERPADVAALLVSHGAHASCFKIREDRSARLAPPSTEEPRAP